jgi:hypothetical protein
MSPALARGRAAKQSDPFPETSAKAELGRGLPCEARQRFPPPPAFGVRRVPVSAARQENVNSQRVVLGPHRCENCLRLFDRVCELYQGVLKLVCAHVFI